MLSILFLFIAIISIALTTYAQCPQGNGPCTGVCVGVYGSDGKVSHYTCSDGATAAPKDCTATAIGGGGGGDEMLEPGS